MGLTVAFAFQVRPIFSLNASVLLRHSSTIAQFRLRACLNFGSNAKSSDFDSISASTKIEVYYIYQETFF